MMQEKDNNMVTVGLLVRLEAKPGKEAEVKAFITGALPLAQQEVLARRHGLRCVSDHRRSGSLTHSRMRAGGARI